LVTHGSSITAPTPPTKTGHTFAGWYKESDCTTAWDFATDTVTGVTILYAKWTVTSFTLTTTVSPSAGGSVSRSPDATSYDPGTLVTLTATPVAGHTFTNWSGDLSGATNPATITMNADKIVTATFTSSTTIPGDVDGNGTVTMVDALLAARAAVGITTLTGDALLAADVDHDGIISMMDVLLIARIAVS
jgi:uncharacterized repeat protein (TIGR02543 family)